jgi:hypothetical protein
MKCREVFERLSDYLDQEAVAEVCKELEAHIKECEHCRIEVNTLKRTVELYKRMPCCDVPGGVKERLFKVIKFDR